MAVAQAIDDPDNMQIKVKHNCIEYFDINFTVAWIIQIEVAKKHLVLKGFSIRPRTNYNRKSFLSLPMVFIGFEPRAGGL